MPAILTFGLALAAQLTAALIVIVFEERFPATEQKKNGITRNFVIGAILLASGLIARSWFAPLTTLIANKMGAGFIALPSAGFGLIYGFLVYFFVMDLGEYVFHRAQHAIPALWSMHSLHHSDLAFNTTTTIRHFWFDSWLKTFTIWLFVSLVFKVPPLILTLYGLASYYNFITHSNLRINFRRGSWFLNAPAYHRLHHSASPEHFDCNYAALLPIFDVIAGTYRRPGDDEYPNTGLDTGEHPRSVTQAVLWPIWPRLKSFSQLSR